MWTCSSPVAGSVSWAGYIERHDPTTDLDTFSWGTGAGTPLVPSNPVSGAPAYADLVFAPAALDGLLPGEHFALIIARNVGPQQQGDVEFWSVELRET